MSPRLRRVSKYAIPWILGLAILAFGIWIWDSRNYPVPKAVSAMAAPSSPLEFVTDLVKSLRKAKERRYWDSFELEDSTWRFFHYQSKTLSTVHFTGTRIYVDPPDFKIGIPFVNDSAYEMHGEYSIVAEMILSGNDRKPYQTTMLADFGYQAPGEMHLFQPDLKLFIMTRLDDRVFAGRKGKDKSPAN